MASSFERLIENCSLLLGNLWTVALWTPHVLAGFFYLVFPRPRKNIQNEIVLVTGSAQGLGRELALLFAEQGCEVVCVDLNEEENLATVAQICARGGKAKAYVCNVADRAAILKLGEEVGRVDILVNNAGIYPFRNLWNSNEEDIRMIIDVNLLSQFWTLQAFLPGMKERNHGHVVCISSMSALTGLAYHEPYSASKGGISALMASLKLEFQVEKTNVKLTTVYPYFVNTRVEISECVDIRIPPMDVGSTARNIMDGILEELEWFTVPRTFGYVWSLLSSLPTECAAVTYGRNPVKTTAPVHDSFKEWVDRGVFNKTGQWKEQKPG